MTHTPTPATPRGRYFEDFEVGEKLRTTARTITNTDIVNFACLSGSEVFFLRKPR